MTNTKEKNHTILSRHSNTLDLFEQCILFHLDAKCLQKFKDLITLIQVIMTINKWKEYKQLTEKKNCKGIPKSEFMAKRSEIRVLNADEIEGIKKACQVKIEIEIKSIRLRKRLDYSRSTWDCSQGGTRWYYNWRNRQNCSWSHNWTWCVSLTFELQLLSKVMLHVSDKKSKPTPQAI